MAAVAANPVLLAASDGAGLHRYDRVRLVHPGGAPVSAAGLHTGENYLFFYPFLATPCFLLDLGRPAPGGSRLETEKDGSYVWPGGIGPSRSIVAFSAICAHRMTHPSTQVTFIRYRHDVVRFTDNRRRTTDQAGVISCCSERSVYDATDGARVVGGPAPQPLAAIVLEHSRDDDGLHAIGVIGGALFDRFFERFRHRLMLEFRTERIDEPVKGRSEVYRLDDFSAREVYC